MTRAFDTSIWLRPGIPLIVDEPRRPFAERANQIQYGGWAPPRRPLLARLFRR